MKAPVDHAEHALRVHAAPSAERSALHLSEQHAEAVVRLVEAVPCVLRRHHFFLWSQGQLHTLLPHRVLVCGAWAPQQRSMVFEAFHSVVLPAAALQTLTDGDSALMKALAAAWVAGRGRPLALAPGHVQGEPQAQMQRLLQAAGGGRLLVHGVARPQRPGEMESLFVFVADEGPGADAQRLLFAEMLVPYLHSTWRRVQMAEIEFAGDGVDGQSAAQARQAGGGGASRALTAREREILACARHGQSNLQIGEALGISPLTVKNHIQKILRKLGARNRAQAVALAMSQDLLVRAPGSD